MPFAVVNPPHDQMPNSVLWNEAVDGAIECEIALGEGVSSVDLAFPCLSSDQHSKNGLLC